MLSLSKRLSGWLTAAALVFGNPAFAQNSTPADAPAGDNSASAATAAANDDIDIDIIAQGSVGEKFSSAKIAGIYDSYMIGFDRVTSSGGITIPFQAKGNVVSGAQNFPVWTSGTAPGSLQVAQNIFEIGQIGEDFSGVAQFGEANIRTKIPAVKINTNVFAAELPATIKLAQQQIATNSINSSKNYFVRGGTFSYSPPITLGSSDDYTFGIRPFIGANNGFEDNVIGGVMFGASTNGSLPPVVGVATAPQSKGGFDVQIGVFAKHATFSDMESQVTGHRLKTEKIVTLGVDMADFLVPHLSAGIVAKVPVGPKNNYNQTPRVGIDLTFHF